MAEHNDDFEVELTNPLIAFGHRFGLIIYVDTDCSDGVIEQTLIIIPGYNLENGRIETGRCFAKPLAKKYSKMTGNKLNRFDLKMRFDFSKMEVECIYFNGSTPFEYFNLKII